MNVVGIIQARTGSTRLPGKVVKKIGDATILEILLTRLKNVTALDEIVVATTTRKEDDIIEELSLQNDVNVFRGSENNVLDRYYKAAEKYNADIIVRITSDNPLVSLDLISYQVDYLIRENCDYVNSKGIILGTGVETFSFESLKAAWENARNEYETEHVTPYIYEHENIFKIKNVSQLKFLERNDIRLTIDTQEDFDIYLQLEKVFGDLTKPTLCEIVEHLDKNKDMKSINQNIVQKNYRDT
nr:glycosyltransferase family protein [uncultured Methanolobus sp.]